MRISLTSSYTYREKSVKITSCCVWTKQSYIFLFFFPPSREHKLTPAHTGRTSAMQVQLQIFAAELPQGLSDHISNKGQGLPRVMLLCTREGEKVVEKGLWRVNLDVSLPSAVRDVCCHEKEQALYPLSWQRQHSQPSFPATQCRLKWGHCHFDGLSHLFLWFDYS